MNVSLLLAVSLVAMTPSALAGRIHYLSCEEFGWIIKGLDKNEIVTEVQREEIRSELIDATDPICFE